MRRSSRLALESIGSPVKSGASPASQQQTRVRRAANMSSTKRSKSSDSDAYESSTSDRDEAERANKRRKTIRPAPKRSNGNFGSAQQLLSADGAPSVPIEPCALPQRHHILSYHRPLLLDRRHGRDALLKWFDGTSATRGMPWRKPWIDPGSVPDPAALREQLERRAYEVWISEIMLQQTRVAVVIDYWNRWMEKWPTIHALAAASPDDVLAMWRGLGYYSRATRIHEAAKLVCGDSVMKGLLPSDVVELEKKVPGVGRYTAGAITAIVFGEASPMVDGNVLRVLSRQMGVLGDVKTDKATIDLLWSSADALVKAVANDTEVDEEGDVSKDRPRTSNRPGRWGQALMELGSTTCTPKPNCAACPITASCRAYGEGLQSATKKEKLKLETPPAPTDIEDVCTYCKPFEEYADMDGDEDGTSTKAPTKSKAGSNAKDGKKQSSLSSFFTSQNGSSKTKAKTSTPSTEPDAATLEKISNHARKFPVKTIKKAVREEETLVCAIRRKSDGQYLIQKRPEKGLLAGLWEFPSHLLPEAKETTTKSRKETATKFVHELVGNEVKHVGELGSIPWLFSHIKLTMHVHLFVLSDEKSANSEVGKRSRWSDDVDSESMGTGMRKCWTMIQDNDS